MNNQCDNCQNMARWTVSYIVARYLCAAHAAALCESVGDLAGRDKFAAMIEGDRVAARCAATACGLSSMGATVGISSHEARNTPAMFDMSGVFA